MTSWVDAHRMPKRLRHDIMAAVEADWTVEIEDAAPTMHFSKDGGGTVTLGFGPDYPFVAPTVTVDAAPVTMPPGAWAPHTRACDYAAAAWGPHA